MVEYTRQELRDLYDIHVKRVQEEKQRHIDFHVIKLTNEILSANRQGKTCLTKHIVKETPETIQEMVQKLQNTFTDCTIDVVHHDKGNIELSQAELSQALVTVSWELP
jgi:hypothetical protein